MTRNFILLISIFMLIPLFTQGQTKRFSIIEEQPDNTFLQTRYEVAAIIIVYSTIENLNFHSTTGGIKDQEYDKTAGRYIIFIKPEKQIIKVRCPGYFEEKIAPLIDLQSKEVICYSIGTLTSSITAIKGNYEVITRPEGATLTVDGIPDFNKTTPFTFEGYEARMYKIKIAKDRYKTLDTIIQINKDIPDVLHVDLVPEWGNLKITTDPPGANVFINGRSYGNAPVELNGISKGLDIGVYEIKVSMDKYLSETRSITIKPGALEEVDLRLRPRTGLLKVTTEPGEAELFIDGTSMGRSPFQKDMKIGTYQLIIKKDGLITIKKNIEIRENQTEDIKETLTNIMSVTINSNPPGANLVVDGLERGKTPSLVSIPLGTHNIKLRKNDFIDFSDNFVVAENASTFSFNMVSDRLGKATKKLNRNQTYKYISLGLTVGGAGFGIYSFLQANSNYEKYQTATTEATDLHLQIVNQQRNSLISFAGAGLACVSSIVYIKRVKELKKIKASLAYLPENGVGFNLAYEF